MHTGRKGRHWALAGVQRPCHRLQVHGPPLEQCCVYMWALLSGAETVHLASRQYSKEYVKDEEHAHDAHRGIWAGYFEVPADWRREHKGKHDVRSFHHFRVSI